MMKFVRSKKKQQSSSAFDDTFCYKLSGECVYDTCCCHTDKKTMLSKLKSLFMFKSKTAMYNVKQINRYE